MEQHSNILLYVLLGIVITGLLIAASRYRFKLHKKKNDNIVKKTPQEYLSKDKLNKQADDYINQEDTSVTSKAITSQMTMMLKYFNGDMGALLSIVNDPVIEEGSVVFENIGLTIDSHGGELLKSWFSTYTNDRNTWDSILYKDKAAKLLDMLKQCGIQPSTELKVTWDENTAKHYRRLTKIEVGDVCEVLSPCWIYEDKIFEQGLVKPITNNK